MLFPATCSHPECAPFDSQVLPFCFSCGRPLDFPQIPLARMGSHGQAEATWAPLISQDLGSLATSGMEWVGAACGALIFRRGSQLHAISLSENGSLESRNLSNVFGSVGVRAPIELGTVGPWIVVRHRAQDDQSDLLTVFSSALLRADIDPPSGLRLAHTTQIGIAPRFPSSRENRRLSSLVGMNGAVLWIENEARDSSVVRGWSLTREAAAPWLVESPKGRLQDVGRLEGRDWVFDRLGSLGVPGEGLFHPKGQVAQVVSENGLPVLSGVVRWNGEVRGIARDGRRSGLLMGADALGHTCWVSLSFPWQARPGRHLPLQVNVPNPVCVYPASVRGAVELSVRAATGQVRLDRTALRFRRLGGHQPHIQQSLHIGPQGLVFRSSERQLCIDSPLGKGIITRGIPPGSRCLCVLLEWPRLWTVWRDRQGLHSVICFHRSVGGVE